MAEFLETTGISAELTDLIKNANEKLFLISPYLQISNRLRLLIRERDSRNIDIKVVFKTDRLNAEELSYLQELSSVKVLACENLHAKCYLNENTALITSMNLYQHSQQNNWEMGIKIDKAKDPQLYKKVYDESMLIIQTSQHTPFSIRKTESESTRFSKNTFAANKTNQKNNSNDNGFCIRCGKDIKLNQKKPFCIGCYTEWEKYRNADYEEKFCHGCKKEHTSTMNKPFCLKCFKKANPI